MCTSVFVDTIFYYFISKRLQYQFLHDFSKSYIVFRRELLVKHTKIHMPIEKFFECDVCEKKFHRSDNLRLVLFFFFYKHNYYN